METSTLFLGTIALATLVMAVVQVGMIIYGVRLVQRVHHLVDQVEKEIKPALIRVNEISGDMNRATSLAVAQLERIDELLGQFSGRADNLMTFAQDALVTPIRQGVALLQGMRAALAALRDVVSSGASSGSAESVGDDEEALFIG
jgi:ABC-type transporter Mla subunit MlaD